MKNLCNGCGLCCKLFYINLSKEEYASGRYKTIFADFAKIDNFSEAQKCGANLLSKNEDGSCVYVENNSCVIHGARPTVCRKFFCTTKAEKFVEMVKVIRGADVERVSLLH
jgi:Fe-S-cluster containining protein